MRLILRRPPPLWTLLLLSNMAVLALPVTGLWIMRLYESALVRQTEVELIAQAAVWTAAFRAELRRSVPDDAPAATQAGATGVSAAAAKLLGRAGLDLADDPVLPPAPDAAPAPQQADPLAAAVGAALTPMLRDAQSVTLSSLRMTDANGTIVASTANDLGLSLAGWDEVAEVLAGAPIASTMRQRLPVRATLDSISRTSNLRVFVALPVQGRSGIVGAVVLSRTPRNVWQTIWGKRYALIGLSTALFAAGVQLAAGLSHLVTHPVRALVAQARRAESGGDIAPLRHPGTREVADLSAALTRMAATLDRRARYITAFAASVSHEFKTPLAGLRGAAELLSDHADTLSDEERRKLLGVVETSAQRLDQLVRRLLELAQADMMRPGIDAVTPVARVMDELLPRYRANGMDLDALVHDETVALGQDALEALLTSLLDNAATHAVGAKVSIRADARDGRVAITIADQGPGISRANRARIFDPFFTTARRQGGSGLGLSIVRAIAAGAGGTAELVPSEGGACFRVELPGDAVQAKMPASTL